MTIWLNQKSEEVQNNLLSQSAKKAQSLREKHKQDDEIGVKKNAQEHIYKSDSHSGLDPILSKLNAEWVLIIFASWFVVRIVIF